MDETDATIDFVGLTTEIVSAYLSNNPVPLGDLANLIERVHTALLEVVGGRVEIKSA